MKIILDCFGDDVRLTDERLAHIVGYVELIGMESEIEHVLRSPTEVRVSLSDDDVRLFYEFHAQTGVGRWEMVLCEVKYLTDDAFVITAYLTDTLKTGEAVWLKK